MPVVVLRVLPFKASGQRTAELLVRERSRELLAVDVDEDTSVPGGIVTVRDVPPETAVVSLDAGRQGPFVIVLCGLDFVDVQHGALLPALRGTGKIIKSYIHVGLYLIIESRIQCSFRK